MQEAFLHYVWQYQLFSTTKLQTVNNESIEVINVGQHNQLSGPDFFNSQLKINNQLWAGNVEIHITSKDWYTHNHEQDSTYNNVILHVVWEHDADIYRKNNSIIPTLELKSIVLKNALTNYQKLFNKTSKWILCQNQISTVNEFTITNWLERLYVERLEEKSKLILALLKQSNNNWETVFFKMLAKNFGLNINGEAFLSLAKSFNFNVIRKLETNLTLLEALLLGQANLLEQDTIEDSYYKTLKNEYNFLKQKFKLTNQGVLPFQFFKLRPNNFPTIRLAQLASLLNKHNNLFSKCINAKSIENIQALFKTKPSDYWTTHYNFTSTSKKSVKYITKSFINLLIINTIIPIQFCYAKHQDNFNSETILNLIKQLPIEKNTIVTKFLNLKPLQKTALQSQAIIQLKNKYCNNHLCLQCAIGNSILKEK